MLGSGGGAFGSFCAFCAMMLVLAIAPFNEYGLGAYGFTGTGFGFNDSPYTPFGDEKLELGLIVGVTGLVDGGKSVGSDEFVLFNFPRENMLFDFVFVRPLGGEGDGGLGLGDVAGTRGARG